MRLLTCLLKLLGGVAAAAQIRTVPLEDLLEETAAGADSSSLRFGTTALKAGPMREDAGPSRYIFPFENGGQKPVRIVSIGSNCSCVRALQGVGTVAPGEASQIVMEFDPTGHPGRFLRKLFVRSDEAVRPVAVLTLEVEVLSANPLADYYPVDMGTLRLRRDSVSFSAGRPAEAAIRAVNVGNGSFSPEFETAFLPSCIKVSCEPQTLAPGQEGMIQIRYEPGEEETPAETARLRLMVRGTGTTPSRSVIFIEIKK